MYRGVLESDLLYGIPVITQVHWHSRVNINVQSNAGDMAIDTTSQSIASCGAWAIEWYIAGWSANLASDQVYANMMLVVYSGCYKIK